MSVYRLSDSASDALTRRAGMSSVLVGGAAAVVGIVIAVRNTQPASMWPLAMAIPLLCIAGFFGVRQALRRQRLAWQSFELSLTPEGLHRRMAGYPDVEIRRDEISAIEERPSGLVVRSRPGGQALLIPKGLVGFDEVRQHLTAHHSIQKPGGDTNRLVSQMLAVVATVGVFAVVFLSTDPRVVVPLALIMLAGAAWTIWAVRRSPDIDERTKRTIWIVLMPALGAVFKALSTLGVE